MTISASSSVKNVSNVTTHGSLLCITGVYFLNFDKVVTRVNNLLIASLWTLGSREPLGQTLRTFSYTIVSPVLTEAWLSSLDVNLSSHMKMVRACVPYLKLGFDPSVVMMGSKNVPAPGPGAGAYSVAKAGLTQFARVAALELGAHGIRVNVLHPNAVYDTAIWSDDVLQTRASSYGLSVEEYKKSNVLKQEVASRDVAIAAALFAGRDLKMTTGAQIPIDGGNERVI